MCRAPFWVLGYVREQIRAFALVARKADIQQNLGSKYSTWCVEGRQEVSHVLIRGRTF